MMAAAGQERFEILVADKRFHTKVDMFQSSDTACATPVASVRYVESYEVKGTTAVTPGAKKIDFVVEARSMTPLNAQVVTNWNNQYYCGYGDWQLGVAKDIAGKTCTSSNGTSAQIDSIGKRYYDIYKVEGTRLYMGDASTGTGTSDATRPTTLQTGYYTKR